MIVLTYELIRLVHRELHGAALGQHLLQLVSVNLPARHVNVGVAHAFVLGLGHREFRYLL